MLDTELISFNVSKLQIDVVWYDIADLHVKRKVRVGYIRALLHCIPLFHTFLQLCTSPRPFSDTSANCLTPQPVLSRGNMLHVHLLLTRNI